MGRGQILGIQGPGWRQFFSLLQAAAGHEVTPHASVAVNDEAELVRSCDRIAAAGAAPLWLISLAAPFTPDQLRPLLDRLEVLGRQGGGAVIAAEQLPDGAPLTLVLPSLQASPQPPVTAGLLDDQQMRVNHLRQGEWGSLRFPLGALSLLPHESVQLRVFGGGEAWLSHPTELAPWKSLAACPAFCIVSFAAPWPQGNYSACLLFSGVNGASPTCDIPFIIKPSMVNPVPAGRHVRWHFTGAPPVSRQKARLQLSLAPRGRLEFGDADRDYLLEGWHEAEAIGDNEFHRWTQGRATGLLGGPGNRLHVTLEDRRPRRSANDATRLVLRVGELAPAERQWDLPGRREVELPWPDDAMLHQFALEITPSWSPKQLGVSEDSREFGLLIHSIRVIHGR